ncbi:MAG: DUF1592 domain-containing protein [Myxococcota bacterium]
MQRWRLLYAATFVVGCTAQISDPGGHSDPKAGSGSSNGGSNSSAAGNSATSKGGATGSSAGGNGASGNNASMGGANASAGSTGSSGNSACTPGIKATSQIARLTNAQYDRTIVDLLGVQSLKAANNVAPSTVLATDQAGGLTDLGWSSYKSVADLIASQVMSDANLKKNFIKCTPSGDGKACLHDTIVQFGRRAFRRPLTNDEVARFDAIVQNGASITQSGTFDQIAEALLYMFLISPSFLQRAEIAETTDSSGRFVLSSHEVASRLSYMLWGSIPDETLNQAADQGQLSTPAQILAQAQRMIKLDKARGRIADFHRYYLLMGTNTRWDTPTRDSSMFPAFTKSVIPSLIAETEMFFDHIVFTKTGTFQDLLQSPIGFVNAALAPLYGLSPSQFGSELKEVTLDAQQRPGFLTRVGFLNAYSSYNRTSPILRGAFITKQVLGIPIGAPPPGAEATELPASSATLDTNRKQVDAQTSGGTCEGCHHNFINPPGFVMEAYNAVGSWQTVESGTKAPIDTVADVMLDGVPVRVTNPSELMAKIAASPTAQRRYAEKWVSFAYEREGEPLDSCTVNQLSAKITAGGYTVLNLITDLTQAEQFRVRAVEVTP